MNNRQRKKLAAKEHNEARQKWIDEAPQRAEAARAYASSKEASELSKKMAVIVAMSLAPNSSQA